MKAFLIDPEVRVILEVNDDFNKLNLMQAAVEGHIELAGYITGDDGRENIVWCDDEGLLKLQLVFTEIAKFPNPLAGRLLILGSDGEGGNADCTMTYEEVSSMVSFITIQDMKKNFLKNK